MTTTAPAHCGVCDHPIHDIDGVVYILDVDAMGADADPVPIHWDQYPHDSDLVAYSCWQDLAEGRRVDGHGAAVADFPLMSDVQPGQVLVASGSTWHVFPATADLTAVEILNPDGEVLAPAPDLDAGWPLAEALRRGLGLPYTTMRGTDDGIRWTVAPWTDPDDFVAA